MEMEIQGLNKLEFARARKNVVMGKTTEEEYEKASPQQRLILRHIELAISSIDIEDLSELED